MTATTTSASATLEWPVDATSNYLSSDLFGGDLFGDELMDMYSAVTADDPELVSSVEITDQATSEESMLISTSDLKMAEAAVRESESADDGLGALRPATSFNDFTQLFPSGTETGTLSLNVSAMATATAAALSVSTVSTDIAENAAVDAAVAVSTKGITKKAKNSGGAKKRKIFVPQSAAMPAGNKAVQGISRPVSKARRGAATVSSAVATPAERSAKRLKTAATQGPGAKKAAASSRKAALAEAVSQYAPLAASQVSKIRQSASILDKPVLRNHITQAICNVANPLDGEVQDPQSVSDQKLRPTTPNAGAENEGNAPTLVSPGGSEIPMSVASSNVAMDSAPTEDDLPHVAAVSTPAATEPLVVRTYSVADPLAVAAAIRATENVSSKISTAHVNSLTSSNWSNTTAASSAVVCPMNVAASKAAAAQAQKRRASLTVEDRAKQNRDRNREHARNTRLRKKAYVEELKKTLTEIVAQRDALELEKISDKQRDGELRNVRFSVIQEFLRLRSTNEQDAKRWSSILDDNFVLHLPVTAYRKMAHQISCERGIKTRRVSSMDCDATLITICSDQEDATMSHFQQELKGISQVMLDSTLVSEMLLSFDHVVPNDSDQRSSALVLECDRSTFMMDDLSVVMNWAAKTVGCVSQGAAHELTVKGNLRASFDAATNKLVSVEMYFDTNAVASQLQSMYPLSFCDGAVHVHEDADETAELLDSLNVPQFEGLLNETSHSISGESSCDEKDDDETKPNGVTTRRSSMLKKNEFQ